MPGDPRFEIGPGQSMLGSSVGSIVTALSVTPLEVIKTRLQSHPRYVQTKKCYLFCNGLMQHLFPLREHQMRLKQKPNGLLEAFVQISRYEGIGSLWSGLGPTLVSAVPSTVLYFVMYETLRKNILKAYYSYEEGKKENVLPLWVALTSGLLARSIALVLTTPIEVIRIKKQATGTSYGEIYKAMKTTVATDGILSLWRALPSAVLRDCPFSAIYWMTYEFIKREYLETDQKPSFLFTMAAGAASGSIAAIVTTPMDVVTTITTIELGEKLIYADSPDRPQRMSITKRLSNIYEGKGVRGVFAGMMPRLLRVPIACSIMITIYEYSKQKFYDFNERRYNK